MDLLFQVPYKYVQWVNTYTLQKNEDIFARIVSCIEIMTYVRWFLVYV